MTRPPTYSAPGVPADEEVLDELGDDAIVAQQAVHAPQPRAQVEMESRTIVVADEPAAVDPSEVMETRQLPQYGGGMDATTAARRAAARAPTMVLQRSALGIKPKKKRNWLVIGIWITAGVVAFGFGGVLAALTARGSAEAQPSAVVAVPPPPAPAPPKAVEPAPAATPTQAPAEPVEAVTATELPVEPTRKPKRPKAPATAAAKPATPAAPTKSAPVKTDIPEGI